MIGHRGPPNPRPEPLPRSKPSPKLKIKNGHICHLCSIYDSVWRDLCGNNPNNQPVTRGEFISELSIINERLETIIDLLRRNKP